MSVARPEVAVRRTTVIGPLVVVLAAAWATAATGIEVRVERVDGTEESGRLVGLDASKATIATAAETRQEAVADLRRLIRSDTPAAARAAVVVTTVDGGRLEADDFLWEGDGATVVRGAERGTLPIEQVQMVAWPRPGDGGRGPAWLAGIPERPDADLVVVGGGAESEYVSCAITAVSAETVTVILDGDTIPVKRGKVAGLRWLRQPPEGRGNVRVMVAGGELVAESVAWSPQALVLDGRIRLPAGWLAGIDYAAGRTVRLAGLATEELTVEPFFAGLADVEGLSTFFAPREVTRAAESRLLVRPRTRAVWRIPDGSRRFRGLIEPAAGDHPGTRSLVVVAIDDREVFRGEVGPAAHRGPDGGRAAPLDVDLVGGRRLSLTVDFVAGALGCPVQLSSAVFEK